MIYQGNIPAVCCAQIREYQAVNTLNTSLHHREVRLAQVSIGIVAGEVRWEGTKYLFLNSDYIV